VVGSDAKVPQAEPSKPAVQIPGMPTGDESSAVSDPEADEMEEHLRGLGYIE
jgi:hypothetical protein